MSMNSIAVLTSGGDAPGMNAAVRAVARTAIANGIRVIGVRRGYNGLISGDVFEMNLRSVSDIIHRGGTSLFTARSPEFNTPAGVQKAADTCRDLGIGGVVVIGGDGSFRGARDLTNAGIPCVGIPGTIDNDIQCSEYTIGFDTAMNTAMEMVDRIRDTAQSHDRCSVVEVMGRRCGDIALLTGIAVGATSILVPEVEYDFQKDIIDRMQFTQMTGKKHFIVVVAEGIGGVEPVPRGVGTTCREHAGMTPLGMTFSEMASMTGGGVQTPGFMGHGKQFISSKKCLKAEGGLGRIVWMPKELKDQVRERLDAAAKELYDVDNFPDMIADEPICTEDPEQLMNYLSEVGHPVLSMEPFDM